MLVVTNLSICLLFAWVVRTPVRFATLHCICYANISLWFFNLLISVKVLGAFWCDLFSCKFKSCIHCCNFTLWSWICILCDTQLMSYVGLWNRDIEQNTAKPTVVLYSSFKICADKDFLNCFKKKKNTCCFLIRAKLISVDAFTHFKLELFVPLNTTSLRSLNVSRSFCSAPAFVGYSGQTKLL